MQIRNYGFTLMETLVSCLISVLLIVSLGSLEVKNLQLMNTNQRQNEAQQAALNLRELTLSIPVSTPLITEQLLTILNLKQTQQIHIANKNFNALEIKSKWNSAGESPGNNQHTFALSVHR